MSNELPNQVFAVFHGKCETDRAFKTKSGAEAYAKEMEGLWESRGPWRVQRYALQAEEKAKHKLTPWAHWEEVSGVFYPAVRNNPLQQRGQSKKKIHDNEYIHDKSYLDRLDKKWPRKDIGIDAESRLAQERRGRPDDDKK